jgi:hypothetical protein
MDDRAAPQCAAQTNTVEDHHVGDVAEPGSTRTADHDARVKQLHPVRLVGLAVAADVDVL